MVGGTRGAPVVPMPFTTKGWPKEFTVSVTLPVCAPAEVGLKVYVLSTQLAPAANAGPQLLVAVPPPNSPPGNAPEMNDIGTVNPEMFVNVVDCGALVAPTGIGPKSMMEGVILRPDTPLPLTTKGGPKEFTVSVTLPVCAPAEVGLKVQVLSTQLDPPANARPQLLVAVPPP